LDKKVHLWVKKISLYILFKGGVKVVSLFVYQFYKILKGKKNLKEQEDFDYESVENFSI